LFILDFLETGNLKICWKVAGKVEPLQVSAKNDLNNPVIYPTVHGHFSLVEHFQKSLKVWNNHPIGRVEHTAVLFMIGPK
jgi:hypothetical protein